MNSEADLKNLNRVTVKAKTGSNWAQSQTSKDFLKFPAESPMIKPRLMFQPGLDAVYNLYTLD